MVVNFVQQAGCRVRRWILNVLNAILVKSLMSVVPSVKNVMLEKQELELMVYVNCVVLVNIEIHRWTVIDVSYVLQVGCLNLAVLNVNLVTLENLEMKQVKTVKIVILVSTGRVACLLQHAKIVQLDTLKMKLVKHHGKDHVFHTFIIFYYR